MENMGLAAMAYRDNPGADTLAELDRFDRLTEYYFDLREVPEALQHQMCVDKSILLWEVLARIQLPVESAIPDVAAMEKTSEEGSFRYAIPHTEIYVVRIEQGKRTGDYLFSAHTVRHVHKFYESVKDLPYLRTMTVERPRRIQVVWGGWRLLPPKSADALPGWLRHEWGGQAVWKTLAVALFMMLALVLSWLAHRLTRLLTKRYSLGVYLRRMAGPAMFTLVVPLLNYLMHYEVWITGQVAQLVRFGISASVYLSMAWLAWWISLFIAEIVISSPRIPDRGLDAHLLRLLARIVGLIMVTTVCFWGGNHLGLPLYGLIAGASVGGLAIALAAQNSLENFLGSISLFADRPVRVGEFCSYADQFGTIEEIGLRSTRIRGLDWTVTSIPNSDFARMRITNLTRRDRFLMRAGIALRLETEPDQLRYVLARLRELLLAHPKVMPDPARVRFINVDETGLNLEIFAYIEATDWSRFLEIQEDINLRIIDVIVESGTTFAFPSQTVYFTRDQGVDPKKSVAAMAQVQQWRAENKLPFPDFDRSFDLANSDKHKTTLGESV
ncbi:mechanosensitive ion channel family protein [Planctomycetota bacterium]